MQEGRVFGFGDKFFRSGPEFVRPLDAVAVVGWEAAPTQAVIAVVPGSANPLKRLVTFCSPSPGRNSLSPSNLPESDVVVLTFMRRSIDIVELTRHALDYSRSRKTSGSRYRVVRVSGAGNYSNKSFGKGGGSDHAVQINNSDENDRKFLHWNQKDIGSHTTAKPFECYVLDESSTQARDDFKRWMSLKSWYNERGIPWRRGHLYYGPPGTGKTSLARAIAQEADMPVFAFDLSSLSNNEFCAEWQRMQGSTPCMALIEDIDGCFDGRKNVLEEHGSGLTFDCLLNAIGGIESCDGVFVVITTNKPESLDEAIGKPSDLTGTQSSRPGRIDRVYQLALPSMEQSEKIITRILGECSQLDRERVIGMSAAQVTEYAINEAMREMFATSC